MHWTSRSRNCGSCENEPSNAEVHVLFGQRAVRDTSLALCAASMFRNWAKSFADAMILDRGRLAMSRLQVNGACMLRSSSIASRRTLRSSNFGSSCDTVAAATHPAHSQYSECLIGTICRSAQRDGMLSAAARQARQTCDAATRCRSGSSDQIWPQSSSGRSGGFTRRARTAVAIKPLQNSKMPSATLASASLADDQHQPTGTVMARDTHPGAVRLSSQHA